MTEKEKDELARVLDARIATTQKLAEEAQRWANRLGQLMNDLQVLRRARDLLLEKEPALGEQSQVHVVVFGSTSPPTPEVRSESQFSESVEGQPLSIGALVVKILGEAAALGGRHAHVRLKTILERVHTAGRPEVTLKTLGGVISQYAAKGIIKRTARAEYALPAKPNVNGTPAHADAH